MNKRKSFVFARQYRNYFSPRINALVLRNWPIKTAIGMGMNDFHGLKTMTSFHCIPNIAYFWLAVTEIIQLFSLNVTFETLSKTKLKTGKIQESEYFEILGSEHSLISGHAKFMDYMGHVKMGYRVRTFYTYKQWGRHIFKKTYVWGKFFHLFLWIVFCADNKDKPMAGCENQLIKKCLRSFSL